MFLGFCIGVVVGLCVAVAKPDLAFMVNDKLRNLFHRSDNSGGP
jgi:hypothetical protein